MDDESIVKCRVVEEEERKKEGRRILRRTYVNRLRRCSQRLWRLKGYLLREGGSYVKERGDVCGKEQPFI